MDPSNRFLIKKIKSFACPESALLHFSASDWDLKTLLFSLKKKKYGSSKLLAKAKSDLSYKLLAYGEKTSSRESRFLWFWHMTEVRINPRAYGKSRGEWDCHQSMV